MKNLLFILVLISFSCKNDSDKKIIEIAKKASADSAKAVSDYLEKQKSGISEIKIKKEATTTIIGKTKFQELSYNILNTDTTYYFMFTDSKIGNIEGFHFSSKNNSLQQFHTILKSFFLKENVKNKNYTVEFNLGDEQIKIFNHSYDGVISAKMCIKNGCVYIDERSMNVIFGS